ncbi:MAG: twin-arginine translocase subunit TatC [Pseudomonadota bacterium]
MSGAEQPLIAHLLELRNRLVRALLGIALCLIPLAIFSKELYEVFAAPLLALMPAGTSMIATEVVSPFLTPLKLSAAVSVFIAMPWVLYQIWAFVAPGLYQNERRFAVPLLASSTLLFYAGIAFAYCLVLPTVFKFTIGFAPEGVAVMTDIGKYLDFALGLFFAFGVAFETPVAIVLLVRTGFVTPAKLASVRDYVFVGAFVVGAIFTPPDVVSQFMLAIPVYLLYELGILAARWTTPGMKEVEAQQAQNAKT